MTRPSEHELAAAAIGFRETLDHETDRGCALMAAAYLDDQLKRLLQTVFVDDASVVDPLFEGARALATFSSRIDMVYVVGAIPPLTRRDLHLIRRIRNKFGHTAELLDFTDPGIINQCSEFTYCVAPPDADARDRFTSAALCVCGQIHRAIQDAEQSLSPEDPVISEGDVVAANLAARILPEPPSDPESVKAWLKMARSLHVEILDADIDDDGV